MDDQEQKEQKQPRKTSARKTRAPRKRKTAPPNNVQPGAVHETIALFILDALRSRTADKIGTPLDVGDLSEADNTLVNPDEQGGREPVELLARIIAHIGHRIPFFSKVEKRLEGKDAKSGLASDITAFVVQLWQRNRALAPNIAAAAQAQAAQRRAAAQQPQQPVQDFPYAVPVTDVTDETVSQHTTQGG